jgi:hypothetical protein
MLTRTGGSPLDHEDDPQSDQDIAPDDRHIEALRTCLDQGRGDYLRSCGAFVRSLRVSILEYKLPHWKVLQSQAATFGCVLAVNVRRALRDGAGLPDLHFHASAAHRRHEVARSWRTGPRRRIGSRRASCRVLEHYSHIRLKATNSCSVGLDEARMTSSRKALE